MEALARSAGINFILDREIRSDLRASIYVRNVRVEDALDLIIQNHQLEKKVLTPNTILVYPSTPQKLREHQELVMRSFQLGNADPKQTLSLLRTMLKTKDLFVELAHQPAGQLAYMPEAIRAAEKLIAAQDKADPEVELELEILEVSRSKIRELGVTYPTTFTGPTGKLGDIAKLSRGTIGVDTGFGLKLLRTDGDTRTSANSSRVRVRNREKARIHVGDRVPVISSTIVGTMAGAAGAAPITTNRSSTWTSASRSRSSPTIHADGVGGRAREPRRVVAGRADQNERRHDGLRSRHRQRDHSAASARRRDAGADGPDPRRRRAGRIGTALVSEAPVLDHVLGQPAHRTTQPRAGAADHAATGARTRAHGCDRGRVLVGHRGGCAHTFALRPTAAGQTGGPQRRCVGDDQRHPGGTSIDERRGRADSGDLAAAGAVVECAAFDQGERRVRRDADGEQRNAAARRFAAIALRRGLARDSERG